MTVLNSILRLARQKDTQTAPETAAHTPPGAVEGFRVPPDLAGRYRIVTAPGAKDEPQRIMLFRQDDTQRPTFELSQDRIVARREDAGTIQDLIELAKANGWERLNIAGSPTFRREVWKAAVQQGLEADGHRPSKEEMAWKQAVEEKRASERDQTVVASPASDRTTTSNAIEKGAPIERTPPAEVAERNSTPKQNPSPAEPTPPDTAKPVLGRASAATRMVLVDPSVEHDASRDEAGKSPHNRDGRFTVARTNSNNAADHVIIKTDSAVEAISYLCSDQYTGLLDNTSGKILAQRVGFRGEPKAFISPELSTIQQDMGEGRFIIRSKNGPHADNPFELSSSNSPMQAIQQFKRDPEGSILDSKSGKQLAYVEWVNDGSYAEWKVDPSLTEMARVEALEIDKADQEATTQHHTISNPDNVPLHEAWVHGDQAQLRSDPRLVDALKAHEVMKVHIAELHGSGTPEYAVAEEQSRQMIGNVLKDGLTIAPRESIAPAITTDLQVSQAMPPPERSQGIELDLGR